MPLLAKSLFKAWTPQKFSQDIFQYFYFQSSSALCYLLDFNQILDANTWGPHFACVACDCNVLVHSACDDL